MKLVIIEAHPVQYRAPVFQRLHELRPGTFEVLYAGDSSTKGYHDKEFGKHFAWDVDLLSGYPNHILNTERVKSSSGYRRFGGHGVYAYLKEHQSQAILIHTLSCEFDWAAYLSALRLKISLWIRLETQDEAVIRGTTKSALRAMTYRMIYRPVKRAFFIGKLNRQHLLSHGIPSSRLRSAHYCTPDPLGKLSAQEKQASRDEKRAEFELATDDLVVGFAGKLIQKKDPELLLQMAEAAAEKTGRRIIIWFIGSGELEESLKITARSLESRANANVRVLFHGFVNQSKLPAHYLAMDILVLPSRRMGETWGLVVNEALQAGCSVIVSEAVGCSADFSALERFKIIPIGCSAKLTEAVVQLSHFCRDFEWSRDFMADYSIEAAAVALAEGIDQL